MIPRSLRRERLFCAIQAIALWCALAYSVGWYHTLTRYGARGWPLPSPETASAYIAYSVSLSHFHPPYETVWWFALFPAVGIAWTALLCMTSGYFGGQAAGILLSSRLFALCSLPMTLLGPIVTYYVWRDGGGVNRLFLTAARFGLVEPQPWLGPAFMALAVLSLILHVAAQRKNFSLHGDKALLHFGVCLALLMCVVAGASIFVRDGLERVSDYF